MSNRFTNRWAAFCSCIAFCSPMLTLTRELRVLVCFPPNQMFRHPTIPSVYTRTTRRCRAVSVQTIQIHLRGWGVHNCLFCFIGWRLGSRKPCTYTWYIFFSLQYFPCRFQFGNTYFIRTSLLLPCCLFLMKNNERLLMTLWRTLRCEQVWVRRRHANMRYRYFYGGLCCDYCCWGCCCASKCMMRGTRISPWSKIKRRNGRETR